jgi:hypothetical protein
LNSSAKYLVSSAIQSTIISTSTKLDAMKRKMPDARQLSLRRNLTTLLSTFSMVSSNSGHITRILDGYVRTAVPHNMAQSLRNAEISLIMHDNCVIRCDITPDTARSIIGTPFVDPWGIWSLRRRMKERIQISRFSRCKCWTSGKRSGIRKSQVRAQTRRYDSRTGPGRRNRRRSSIVSTFSIVNLPCDIISESRKSMNN